MFFARKNEAFCPFSSLMNVRLVLRVKGREVLGLCRSFDLSVDTKDSWSVNSPASRGVTEGWSVFGRVPLKERPNLFEFGREIPC